MSDRRAQRGAGQRGEGGERHNKELGGQPGCGSKPSRDARQQEHGCAKQRQGGSGGGAGEQESNQGKSVAGSRQAGRRGGRGPGGCAAVRGDAKIVGCKKMTGQTPWPTGAWHHRGRRMQAVAGDGAAGGRRRLQAAASAAAGGCGDAPAGGAQAAAAGCSQAPAEPPQVEAPQHHEQLLSAAARGEGREGRRSSVDLSAWAVGGMAEAKQARGTFSRGSGGGEAGAALEQPWSSEGARRSLARAKPPASGPCRMRAAALPSLSPMHPHPPPDDLAGGHIGVVGVGLRVTARPRPRPPQVPHLLAQRRPQQAVWPAAEVHLQVAGGAAGMSGGVGARQHVESGGCPAGCTRC